MVSVTTFYLSRLIDSKVISDSKKIIGKIQDLIVDLDFIRPRVVAVKIKTGRDTKVVEFSNFNITKEHGQYIIKCSSLRDYVSQKDNLMSVAKNILDRQIVDIDGKKLVRVNDLRFASLSTGTYIIAVDVGLEGLLRRLGFAKPLTKLLNSLGKNTPSRLMLWDDVEAVDLSHSGIKLSKEYSKLATLHPSDLADIMEDLDKHNQIKIFTSLDENRAADVLEELETDAQVQVLENLTISKAADVLEKMPADEVADILGEMEDDFAEEILKEMEHDASQEVRELMEYSDNAVGSIMSTDYISFNENMSVNDVLAELRRTKPEPDTIYSLYIVDDKERLTATVSLRDIVIAEPGTKIKEIMNENVLYVYDNDKIDSINEIISKYNLLALPVVDKDKTMLGMVIINDVVYNLLKARRKRVG
jgi:CBS domain-containing protein/sporulation protein YlmC with PRC-barrel domain